MTIVTAIVASNVHQDGAEAMPKAITSSKTRLQDAGAEATAATILVRAIRHPHQLKRDRLVAVIVKSNLIRPHLPHPGLAVVPIQAVMVHRLVGVRIPLVLVLRVPLVLRVVPMGRVHPHGWNVSVHLSATVE